MLLSVSTGKVGSSLFLLGLLFCGQASAQGSTGQAAIDAEGVYHLPPFAVPPSALASQEARPRATNNSDRPSPEAALVAIDGIKELRRVYEAAAESIYKDLQSALPAAVAGRVIHGVQTDVITPTAGVAAHKRDKVLINLHGGGFVFGSRLWGVIGSIPVAHVGGYQVISVDYRLGPEHRFPAASEDVTAVYAELLNTYRSENIGIYGCSVGALLTTQAVASLGQRGLPRPGAIVLNGGGAVYPNIGDSHYLAGAFLTGIPSYPPNGQDFISKLKTLYFRQGDDENALAFPGFHLDVLKGFPPTLIVNSTRDPSMSAAIYTHRQLKRAGVPAELHIWEGVSHCFTSDHRLPEAREAYAEIVGFFDSHLGRSSRGSEAQ